MPAPTGTAFPGAIDTDTDIGTAVSSGEVIASSYVNTSSSAIISLEETIGLVPSTQDWKAHVRVATNAALPSNSYDSGTQVLTAAANGALSVDSVAVNINDRVLVKNEATSSNNGIYVVTAVGSSGTPYTLTRAVDYNQSALIPAACSVAVSEGTANPGTAWTLTTPAPITLDTSGLTYAQFGESGSESSAGALYAADTGSAGAYAIAPSPYITSYAAGQQFVFLAANTNTGSSTLSVSGLSPQNLTKFGTTTLQAGDIQANQMVSVVFDGTQFQVLDPGVIPVAHGGTGATTASGARSNLGAAASGANSDITSLTGLTTALSVAHGGTGATTASGARSNLGAAASGANSDITSLTGLTTALSVAQGGTGATTASGARSDLGAAASGANSDITSLAGLTTPLSVGQGGTGSSTASGARSDLGAAASGANSDITSLSGLTTALSVAQGGTGATTASGARSGLGAAASGANSDITSLAGLTTPLSVGQGGTGSSTASGARSDLGAAASGANSDITSISGLTTALSVAQGGTGSSTASGARTNLSAAESGANSDITALSGLTTALSVAQGGTGATTASGARSDLGAAASGANSDITALSGLTTALSVAQGGTGSSTASGARTNLSAAESGANSDITALSGLTTALSVSQGGTGSSTASGARTNLGIAPALFQSNGDGTTTAFNIGFTPNFPSALMVFVGGLLQRLTTDYTFSGTTVTFGTAPPAGTNNVQAWGM